MKKLVALVSVVSLLSACGTSDPYARRASNADAQQYQNMQSAVDKAPSWMTKLPKSEAAIYENGTAVSGDFGMADMKAKTMAYAKICTAAGGKVRSQMKMFRADTDTSSAESTELAVRSICPNVDITGVETVEMKHVAEGNRIRTYVLVALPLGDANVLKKQKINEQNTIDVKTRAPEAFRELDEVTGSTPVSSPKSNTGAQITPVPDGKTVVSGTNPDGSRGTLKLLEVDNPEYVAKREKCLKTPGCVVGQVTLSDG